MSKKHIGLVSTSLDNIRKVVFEESQSIRHCYARDNLNRVVYFTRSLVSEELIDKLKKLPSTESYKISADLDEIKKWYHKQFKTNASS